MKDLGYMARRIFRQKSLFIAAVLLTMGQCAVKLWLPRMMENIINNGVLRSDLAYIRAIGWQMLGLCVALGACGYGASMLCAVIGQRFGLQLRGETYAHITGLSVLQAARLGYGALITGLTTDIDICASLVSAMILLLIEPVLMTVGGIMMMWRISPTFGWVFAGFVALQLAVMTLFIRSTAPGFAKVRAAMDAMNSRLQNALINFRLTKADNAQDAERGRFDERNAALFDAAYRAQRRIALFNPIIMLIMNLAIACVLWISGRQITVGSMNTGMVLSAIAYSEQVLVSIMAGGQIYRKITESLPSARRIRRILSVQPDLPEGGDRMDGTFRELAFEDVDFEYPGGGRALSKCGFAIRAGEVLAVIGPVGCGKSTLAGLCARLFDATSGRVLLNGRDIRRWRSEDVLSAVALVEKQSAVFEDTLGENIRFGRESVTPEDVRRAASAAQLEAYLADAPQGLDTPMVSMGRNLSGGERQRLTIARALAGNPGLLILDDATSALDYQTERALLNALRRDYPDMAVLLITNRLASARQADRIMLMEGGGISAQGADGALRASSPIYRRICAIQDES